MHLAIYRSSKPRCEAFAADVRLGAEARGWSVDERSAYGSPGAASDAALVVGVRRKELFDALLNYAYVDKGYTREAPWRRVAVGNCEPTRYLGRLGSPPDRRRARGWRPLPWRASGAHILLLWQNESEAEWRGLPAPEDHAESVVAALRHYTDRPIVYRCKPNRAPLRPVAGTVLSPAGRPLSDDLKGAHVAVAIGGSASLHALLAGIPCICIGDAVVAPLSSANLAYVENPRLASDATRLALLDDLAYCQWQSEEWRSGEAWAHVTALMKDLEDVRHPALLSKLQPMSKGQHA